MSSLLTQRASPLLARRTYRHITGDMLLRNERRAVWNIAVRAIDRPHLQRPLAVPGRKPMTKCRARSIDVDFVGAAAAGREERLVGH